MSVDVVTKFTYLVHGEKAPEHSSFKGIITTKSIIGFKKYGERASSRILNQEAEHLLEQHASFFNYTSERIGSTKTYSSNGWIANAQQNEDIKNQIAESFNQDGHIIWVPVISLKDFMTSTEMKLFNEEDYAAVIDKVLPKWFSSAGFQNENMLWWMDHHVNTDNPHLHLCFLEKEKTKEFGMLPMKQINRFKELFYNEVFAQKRFLEEVGISAKEAFQNKDILKKETMEQFVNELKNGDDKMLLQQLKALYMKLPEDGRLQYNSVHMIDYRSELDELVNQFLQNDKLKNIYSQFVEQVKQFDAIKSKNLNTEYKTIFNQEDHKLRIQMANAILKEFKDGSEKFHRENPVQSDLDFEKERDVFVPVAKSIVMKEFDNSYLVRLPQGGKYILLSKENEIPTYLYKTMKVFKFSNYEAVSLAKENGTILNEKIEMDEIEKTFWFGKGYVNSLQNQYQEHGKMIRDFAMRESLVQSNHLNHTIKNVQKASFGWMSKIQQEIGEGRDEYLSGKEMTL